MSAESSSCLKQTRPSIAIMNEAELNAAERRAQDAAPEPWADMGSSSALTVTPALSSAHASSTPPLTDEAPELGAVAPSAHARPFPSRRSAGGVLAAAVSLVLHGVVIAALLLYAPWDERGLQDEDEISVELVDALPQPAPSPEPTTSTNEAQPTPPDVSPPQTQAAVTPAAQDEPPPETDASPPPPQVAPPPVEDEAPPPLPSSPPVQPLPPAVVESEAPPPPPPPPVETPPPVPATAPVRTAPPEVEPAQRERAERLERARREEAERIARERATRAAENAKRQEAQRQEAQRQQIEREAAQREAQRQAAAKAAEASAANAAAASSYRGLVIGHLASFKRYPPAARARGAQGNPMVSFSIDSTGRVVSVSLTRASGDPDIDAEIVAMVHRASPFPIPPPGAPHAFSAGVNFKLQ